MNKIIAFLLDFMKKRSKTPWAMYQTSGIGEDGRIKFEIAFNQAFSKNIAEHGIRGMNDEEAVMMFLVASQMRPEEIEPNTVSSSAHPMLQSEGNVLREG